MMQHIHWLTSRSAIAASTKHFSDSYVHTLYICMCAHTMNSEHVHVHMDVCLLLSTVTSVCIYVHTYKAECALCMLHLIR